MTTPDEPTSNEPTSHEPTANEPGPTNPAGRRRLIALACAAALVVLVLALGWWWKSGARDSRPLAAPGPTSSSTASESPSGTPATVPGSASTSSSGATPDSGATPSAPTTDPLVPSERPTQPPVGLSEPAEPFAGLSARLTIIEPVAGVATLPGEVGGPALRVTVEVTNGTAGAVDLSGAVVNLYYGADMVPTLGLIEPGQQPFPASVAAGGVASGRLIFLVPADSRDHITVEVDVAAQSPVVLFAGAAPAA